jgi:hypothetical protein
MANGTDPSAHAADLRRAREWLLRHGLAEVRATPLLATRLAARHRARRAGLVLLAVLVMGTALTQGHDRLSTGRFGGFQPHSRTPLVILSAFVVGLVLVQAMIRTRSAPAVVVARHAMSAG